MPSRANRDRLILDLFDAVGDSDAITAALERIGRPLGAVAAHAFVIRKADGAIVDNVTYAQSPPTAAFDDYERRWRATDPRFLTALRCPDVVHSDIAVVDPIHFERSGLYNENLRTAGIRYTLFGNFSISPELLLPLAFMRPKGAGGYQGDDVAYLTELMPSVARAFRLHELMRDLAQENRDLRSALDRMPSPVAIVREGGRIHSANAAARAILSRADGLCTQGGVLTAMHPDDARRLAARLMAALAQARAAADRPAPRSSSNVVVRRERGAPLEVVFLPITEVSAFAPSGHVMAVIYDPDRAVMLDEDLVARMYGLTATEAEVAVALATGRSLTNIAADRGCSEQTVRTHLKRIFGKTGLTRQTELVRVLLTGPAIHSP